MTSPELQVGITVVIGLLLWLGVQAFKAWLTRPAAPDPWGPDVAKAMEQPDATPICPHCQSPHAAQSWFCPECGRVVGDYNNLNPYLYLFSLGEVLREGTTGHVRKSWLTVAGFLLLSLIEYLVLAPIYWFFFFRNLSQEPDVGAASGEPPVITRD
ncbi:MAG TPA: zinc ribbon domain-containing protein [Verrucomicrobiae bacterium]|nr:zinc ribbon domain-containing protein [Verrucomicrobiae bacterium]